MARSDNWRINKSGVMAVEGAQVLKALRKVAGAAGLPSNFQVKFATKARGSEIRWDTKEVVIAGGRLFQEAPVPPDLFDVLVGLTLHEVGHQQIDSDRIVRWVNELVRGSGWTGRTEREANIFLAFTNIGEDIVVESRTRNNPNLAEYDECLHKWAVSNMDEATPHKLLDIWIEYALGHKSTGILDLPDHLVEPMQQLVALTGWLRRDAPGTVARFEAYQKYWNTVRDMVMNPPQPPQPDPQDQQDDTQQQQQQGADDGESGIDTGPDPSEPPAQDNSPSPESGAEADMGPQETPVQPEMSDDSGADDASAPDQDDSTDQTQSGSGGQDIEDDVMDRPLSPSDEDAIDDKLAQDIEDAIESDLEDITDEVAQEFGDHLASDHFRLTYPIIRSRETKTPLIKPDPRLRKQLERILTIRKRLQSRTMHGEKYGKIDKHHLYRVSTDERVFSLRYKFPDGFPDARILIDLSSSMNGGEADEVLEAAGALQTLVNAEVWCYYFHERQVSLIRADEGKLVRRVKPEGGTPSGLAIVGASLGLKKGGLVIHLTDGEHNQGQAPWSAHWILKKKGIDLVNLIWGKDIKQYDMEGMSFKQLNGLADFPEALYQILVEQTKLSKIGGR